MKTLGAVMVKTKKTKTCCGRNCAKLARDMREIFDVLAGIDYADMTTAEKQIWRVFSMSGVEQ